MGIDAMIVHVAFGAGDEECARLMYHIQSSKIDIPSIHHIDGSCLRRDQIQRQGIAHLAIGNMDEIGYGAAQIKQHLRIKRFYGTSENAVKTQIWTAVCVYVLAAVIKKELALDVSLYTFLQILSVHSFEKIQLSCAFLDVHDRNRDPLPSNQLNLFDS